MVASAVEDAQDPGTAPQDRRQETPAVLESPGTGDLGHGREFRARFQRWPERYRPDHAGADRYRAGPVRPRPEQHDLSDRADSRRDPAPEPVLPAQLRNPGRVPGP